jgi:cytochrome P450
LDHRAASNTSTAKGSKSAAGLLRGVASRGAALHDLARPNANAQLAFGVGIHPCIGAALATPEMRVVLETLLARTSALRRPGAKLEHLPSRLVRCPAALPVELAA